MVKNIRYVTADMDFFSRVELDLIVQEIGVENYCAHANGWINGKYQVSLGGAVCSEPEKTIIDFCELIESLSEKSRSLWNDCSQRVIDLAFESGEEPKSVTYHLSQDLINRINELQISIAITIYPVGAYSPNDKNIK